MGRGGKRRGVQGDIGGKRGKTCTRRQAREKAKAGKLAHAAESRLHGFGATWFNRRRALSY